MSNNLAGEVLILDEYRPAVPAKVYWRIPKASRCLRGFPLCVLQQDYVEEFSSLDDGADNIDRIKSLELEEHLLVQLYIVYGG